MSDVAATRPGKAPGASEWSVRSAAASDAPAVATAIEALLAELGGNCPARARLEAEARRLVAEPGEGAILVAEADGEIVGLLGASWQRALHVPGRYATIQDLWVAAEWRSAGVGAGLVEALATLARERGAARLEVGLPRESFAAIARTEAFYGANGFEHLGPRMRRSLP